LKTTTGEDVFNSWFARMELEEVIDELAHLSVPTRFLSAWIQANYADRILESFRAETKDIKRLHFTVRVTGQPRPRRPTGAKAGEPAAEPAVNGAVRPVRDATTPQRSDALSGSALDPRMTFDTFVAGGANEMALGVARQVADAALKNTVTFNPVYFHSTVGLGKSHLL